jgi:dTDP-4-dehydrorhamnose reductase
MARKAAVIGSAGQLGVELVAELNQRGYQTIGWDRDQLDITDNRQVESLLTPWDPEIVFNAAAYNPPAPPEPACGARLEPVYYVQFDIGGELAVMARA